LRPCKQALDFEIFGHQVRKIVGGEGVSKCVIFDVDSIFGVRILSENFSHYTTVVGLGTFRSVKVRISVFVMFEANLLGKYAADFGQIFTRCRRSYPPSVSGELSKPEV